MITSLPRCRGKAKGRPGTGTFAAGIINGPSQSSGLRFPFEPCLSDLGRVERPRSTAADRGGQPYLDTPRAARGAAPTQGITPPILHTLYSILSAVLANRSTVQLTLPLSVQLSLWASEPLVLQHFIQFRFPPRITRTFTAPLAPDMREFVVKKMGFSEAELDEVLKN